MAEKLTAPDGKYLMYKGRPIVRKDNVVCYGFAEDPYVLLLTVMTEAEQNGKKVPDKVLIQIKKTDAALSEREKVVKQDVTSGWYNAFDIGVIWLEQYLK